MFPPSLRPATTKGARRSQTRRSLKLIVLHLRAGETGPAVPVGPAAPVGAAPRRVALVGARPSTSRPNGCRDRVETQAADVHVLMTRISATRLWEDTSARPGQLASCVLIASAMLSCASL